MKNAILLQSQSKALGHESMMQPAKKETQEKRQEHPTLFNSALLNQYDAENVKQQGALTPMLVQYKEQKERYPQCLLLFRLGDFYELFFDDAILASKTLNITLTQRGMHQGKPIPMCGVPFHAADNYIKRLLDQGHHIALCEQTETPEDRKKNGGKGPLKRDVVRLITPATVVEDHFLPKTGYNFLLSVGYSEGLSRALEKNLTHDMLSSVTLSCALLDLSTGTFVIEYHRGDDLLNLLARYQVSEILLPDNLVMHYHTALRSLGMSITPIPLLKYDGHNGKVRVHSFYGVSTFDGISDFSLGDFGNIAVLLDYVELTHQKTNVSLPFPKKQQQHRFMQVDHQTRANLDIDRSVRGHRGGSLFDVLNETVSVGGSRLLHQWLSCPLVDVNSLNDRLDSIDFFKTHKDLRHNLRHILSAPHDLARSLARLQLNKAGPRDLLMIRTCLTLAKSAFDIMSMQSLLPFNLPLIPFDLFHYLEKALQDHVPLLARDGGMIRDGFSTDLDHYRSLERHGEEHLENLQKHYQHETNITTLKLKHNGVIGYFLECPPTQRDKIPPSFIPRQALSNALRFSTTELNALAQQLMEASSSALSLEQTLFVEICEAVKKYHDVLCQISETLAMMDVSASLAELADKRNYTRPVFLKDSDVDAHFTILGGRHPVVEKALQEQSTEQSTQAFFTPNDTEFSKDVTFYLLTGPNMAGKSTYLRQVALLTFMAQCGVFVPAALMKLRPVDRIFSRIGAGDDLFSGRSTFMMEMVETATILNQATQSSLVILDELGRGTSTYDGLSLAWAVTEYLVNNIGCMTLFATHYGEITTLEKDIPTLKNKRMGVKKTKEHILFLHKIEEGCAEESYGLHVAALAGIPKNVLNRATHLLSSFKKGDGVKEGAMIERARSKSKDALPLSDDLSSHILKYDLNTITPLDALNILQNLQNTLNKIEILH